MTKQAALIALARNRGELDATVLGRLLAQESDNDSPPKRGFAPREAHKQ